MLSGIKRIIRDISISFHETKDNKIPGNINYHNDMSNRCNRTHLLFMILLDK